MSEVAGRVEELFQREFAGINDFCLALARGERPEPRLGEFFEGVVMTRYFSGLTLLADADGTLVPFDGVSEPTQA